VTRDDDGDILDCYGHGRCARTWKTGAAAAWFSGVELFLFLLTTLIFLYYYHLHMAGDPSPPLPVLARLSRELLLAPLLEQEPLLRLPGPENTQFIPLLRITNPSARVLACTRVSIVGLELWKVDLVQLAGLEALLEPMQDRARLCHIQIIP